MQCKSVGFLWKKDRLSDDLLSDCAETVSSILTSEKENSGMGGIAMLTLSDSENNLHFILIMQGLIKHKGERKRRTHWEEKFLIEMLQVRALHSNLFQRSLLKSDAPGGFTNFHFSSHVKKVCEEEEVIQNLLVNSWHANTFDIHWKYYKELMQRCIWSRWIFTTSKLKQSSNSKTSKIMTFWMFTKRYHICPPAS